MEIKEAVANIREEFEVHYNLSDDMTTKGYQGIRQAFQALISLAQRYEAVEAVMPKKKDDWGCKEGCSEYSQNLQNKIYNQAIDDCTLAVAKMLEGRRIEKLLDDKKITVFHNGGYLEAKITGKSAKELAQTIINMILGKDK